jgi:predicted transcriptional regulator
MPGNMRRGTKPLEAALRLLGPLEGRIMRQVWTGAVQDTFVVRDIQRLLPDLAYTTLMTTLSRLADKEVLDVSPIAGQRAYVYTSPMDPEGFVEWSSRREADRMIKRYGDVAFVTFADRLDRLSETDRERLRSLTHE